MRQLSYSMLMHITERKVAERSMLIKNMIEDLGAPGEEPIPIMNVSFAAFLSHRWHTDPCLGDRECPSKGPGVVLTPQERPSANPRRRGGVSQEDNGH